jgi:hypothetical protein
LNTEMPFLIAAYGSIDVSTGSKFEKNALKIAI